MKRFKIRLVWNLNRFNFKTNAQVSANLFVHCNPLQKRLLCPSVNFQLEISVKKLSKTALAPVALAAGVLCSNAAWAEVEYHGYFRTGVGSTTAGGNQACFKPSWPSGAGGSDDGGAVGRLGNECTNYGEATVSLDFGDLNGVWGKYYVGFSYKPLQAESYEKAGDKMEFANRQNYFKAGGFFPDGSFEDANIWVGKRYYNNRDIHILDYDVYANTGAGAGVEGFKFGSAKGAVAYLQNGKNDNSPADSVTKRYAFKVYDIPVNEGGKLESELTLISGSTSGTAATGSGMTLMAEHSQDGVLGGFNKLTLVYGKDSGAGFGWTPTYAGSGNGDKGNKSWRLHDQMHFNFKGTNWSGMVAGGIGQIDASWGKPSFTNVVIRPQYNFSKNTSVAFELGHARGKNGTSSPSMTKFTIAPQLTLTEGFWARPVIRAFVTHAKWNKDAGTVANGVFGTATSGTSYGFQAEAWW
ncbi:MAG: hypothetical protein RI959_386 [Pseudomonadota bacterium]